MNIRLSGLIEESIVDGPGIRTAVFAQGCPHYCPGCHNPQTHGFNGGYLEDTDNIIKKVLANRLVCGLTLSGGEPFAQASAFAELAKKAKEKGLSIMTYSGYTLEQLILMAKKDLAIHDLLKYTDILVDGPFIMAEKSLALKYRGSKNQRVIDLRKLPEFVLYCE